jgi:hypothetical protein
MGAALDGFIDEDGKRALDAPNELRESCAFRHREGHMHGLPLVPVESDAGEPDQPLVRDDDREAPRIRFRPPSGRNFVPLDSDIDPSDPSGQSLFDHAQFEIAVLAGLDSAF